ncbi:hypothetical protein Tco_1507054 [Tanacetum coccineum]
MEQYLELTRGNQAPGEIKPKIRGNVNFEIKSQFMRDLREETFSRNKTDVAYEHVERILDIISLFYILGITHDAVMLCVFPITLTRAAKRWVDKLSPGTINTWDLLKNTFIQRYCPPSKSAKQLEEIHNFKQEWDETLYQAWERYNDLLYKCPTHNLNSHQKVNIFYNRLDTMTRQLLDSQGPIPNKTPTQALTAIQTMADHSQKWHNGSTSRRVSDDSSAGIAAITNKLDSLRRDMKKLKENVHAIQVGCENYGGAHLNKECPLHEEVKGRIAETKKGEYKGIYTKEELPLYTPFYYSPKEIEYFFANSSLSDEEVQDEMEEDEEINDEVAQRYGKPQKNKINRLFLKDIRKIDDYSKHIKNLVENILRISEDKDVKMNKRCSTILQNQLPPKEQDPGSFTLRCSIRKSTFNALADLGASISVMPLSMFKRNEKSFMNDDLMKMDHDLFLYNSKSCIKTNEFNYLLVIDPDIFSYEVCEQEPMDEIDYKGCEDLENFGDEKMELTLDIVLDKLDDEWFIGTVEDEDDLDRIVDYLELKSYDGFINVGDEAYKKRMCEFLGMTYETPTSILIKKVEITRTSTNVAAIRVELVKEMDSGGSVQRET